MMMAERPARPLSKTFKDQVRINANKGSGNGLRLTGKARGEKITSGAASQHNGIFNLKAIRQVKSEVSVIQMTLNSRAPLYPK